MHTENVTNEDFFGNLSAALSGAGAFLVSWDGERSPNLMTIGWALQGHLWQKQVLSVFVRPSRHTFELLENSRHFSVCVPGGGLEKFLGLCGSKSGRDTDKIAACGFHILPGLNEGVRVIEECQYFCECETLGQTKLNPEDLNGHLVERFYDKGDFHVVYFGEIKAIYRNRDIK